MRTNLANVLFLVTLTRGAGVGPALADLRIEHNPQTGTLAVYRAGSQQLVLQQPAKPGVRPYLHPIMAPDGRGVLTESSPSHHPHQTGLYWGFTRVNGRDYFHHPGSDYWRRVAVTVLHKVAVTVLQGLFLKPSHTAMTPSPKWIMPRLGE